MGQSYPADWDTRRKAVYQRDNYQCQHCGQRGGAYGNAELHAHHIVPKSSGGSHQLNNLITLCSHCHSAVHGRSLGNQSKAPIRTAQSVSTHQPSVDDSSKVDGLKQLSYLIRGTLTLIVILMIIFGLSGVVIGGYIISKPIEVLTELGPLILFLLFGIALLWPSQVIEMLPDVNRES